MRVKVGFYCLVFLGIFVIASCELQYPFSTQPTMHRTLNIPATMLDWGTIVHGQAVDTLFTFVNDTHSEGELMGTVKITGASFYIVTGGGTFRLDPGASRTVKVCFLPGGSGTFTGKLIINHNADNWVSPFNVALVGRAE